MKIPFIFFSVALASPAFAVTTLSDNFESGSLSTDWGSKSNTTVVNGGPTGSTKYASLGTTTGALGDQIGGADSFVIDYYFQVKNDSVNRQFNLSVSTVSINPSAGDATLNLRYQSGAWSVYNNAWQTLSLAAITDGQWYHMQVEGTGWGSAGASYTLRLSDAGGSVFTSSITSSIIQNGSITGSTSYGTPPVLFPGTAQSFVFSTAYGSNPGFFLDNVNVTANLVIPEPSALGLLGLSALSFMRRRRA